MYVDFYKHLERSNRMVVIDVGACIDLKDVYLFALPPNTPLHRKFFCNTVYRLFHTLATLETAPVSRRLSSNVETSVAL